MAFKAEDITINMSAGQRASALNHISVLRTALYGDCEKELNRFINEMRDKRDEKYELNNRVLAALFFLANISKERHCVEFSELTSDEVTALIGVMNHLRAVVSLFPKRLAMPNQTTTEINGVYPPGIFLPKFRRNNNAKYRNPFQQNRPG